MSKYSAAFKLKVVREMCEGHSSLRETARRYQLDSSGIHLWARRYEYHGEQAFSDMPRPRRPFSAAFKWKVLCAMQAQQLSAREAVALFNLSNVRVIKRWKTRYAEQGKEGLQPRHRQRPPMAKPKRPVNKAGQSPTDKQLKQKQEEIEFLRAENAYLKKLDALMRQKQATGKKR